MALSTPLLTGQQLSFDGSAHQIQDMTHKQDDLSRSAQGANEEVVFSCKRGMAQDDLK